MLKNATPSRFRRCVVTVAIGATAFGCAASVQDASALVPTPTVVDGLAGEAYAGGASQTISGASCNALCSDLRTMERGPLDPRDPASRSLVQDGFRLKGWWRALPKLTGRLSLIGATGSFGFTIGTGLRKSWIGGSAPSPGNVQQRSMAAADIVQSNQSLISGSAGEIRAPEVGWVPVDENGSGFATSIIDHSPGVMPNCTPFTQESLAAAGWTTLKGPQYHSSVNCGPDESHFEALFTPLVTRRSDGLGGGGLEPFTGQTTNMPPIEWWSDQPTSMQELRDRVSVDLPTLEQSAPTRTKAVEYLVGTPNACDPLEPFVCNGPDEQDQSTRERERKCDRGDGGNNRDPDPTRTTEPNAEELYDHQQTFSRLDPQTGDSVPVALHKGWTRRSEGPKEWLGWGWRHIYAKHGWTLQDQVETIDALGTTPTSDASRPGRLIYRSSNTFSPEPGIECRRRVVVQTTRRDPVEPQAPGIVTSFNEVVE